MAKKPTISLTEPVLARVTAYAEAVLAGEIAAGPHVRNSCRRHLDDVRKAGDRGIYWDDEAAQRVFRFFEERLKLSEGQFEGKPFVLHPSQAFKIGSIFGWKMADGTRRFQRAYIEEGKGNGKSPVAGGIGLYGLTADREAGAQIYAAAAKKEQAGILFQDACKMVRASPALSARLKFSGGMGREFNIAHHKSQSFFRPISKDSGKSGSGPRPHFALCDEVHEHPDRTTMEMLERGFKFRQNPLLLMITNSGSDRNTVCWEEHQHAVKVAAGTDVPDEDFTYVGDAIDDRTFSYVCALDKDDDPLTDRSCWIKANPMLGVILTEDYLAGVVNQAKQMPGKLPGILRLHFCVWTDASKGWMARPTVEAVMTDLQPEDYRDQPVFLGIDLSATDDMTVIAAAVPTGHVEVPRPDGTIALRPTFDAWVEAFTPKATLEARAQRDGAPYVDWARDGWLTAVPGQRMRYDYVAYRVAQLAQHFKIQAVAYDNYAYDEFRQECVALGLELTHVRHPQGGVRRAPPDPSLVERAEAEGRPKPEGLWMPGSIVEFENLVIDRRIRLRNSPVLMTALMAAELSDPDPLGNRYLVKQKSTRRIDSAVALVMAVGAALDGAPAPLVTPSPWDDPEFSIARLLQ